MMPLMILLTTLLLCISRVHATDATDAAVPAVLSLTGAVNLTTLPNTLFDPSRTKLVLTDAQSGSSEYYFTSKGEFSIPLAAQDSEYTLSLESLDFRLKQANQFKIIISPEIKDDSIISIFQLKPGFSSESNSELVKLSKLHFDEAQLVLRNYVDDQDQATSLWNYIPMGHYIRQNPFIGYLLLGMVLIILMPQVLAWADPEFAQRARANEAH